MFKLKRSDTEHTEIPHFAASVNSVWSSVLFVTKISTSALVACS